MTARPSYTPGSIPNDVRSLSREDVVRELAWADTSRDQWEETNTVPCPNRPGRHLKSVVMVHGKPEWYSDEELGQMLAFSRSATAEYDRHFGRRTASTNTLHIGIDRPGDRTGPAAQWVCQYRSFTHGIMSASSLQESLESLAFCYHILRPGCEVKQFPVNAEPECTITLKRTFTTDVGTLCQGAVYPLAAENSTHVYVVVGDRKVVLRESDVNMVSDHAHGA